MSKRYEVIGIPVSPPFSVLAGKRVGDVFEADIAEDIEKLLLGGGALRELPRRAPTAAKAKAEAAPKPKPEEPKAEAQKEEPKAPVAPAKAEAAPQPTGTTKGKAEAPPERKA